MGWVIFFILLVLFLGVVGGVYFLYKRRNRGSFARAFSENMAGNELQLQIEDTGNAIIKRLEEQIKHLEYLLEESDTKMLAIDEKMHELTKLLNKAQNIEVMQSSQTKQENSNFTAINYERQSRNNSSVTTPTAVTYRQKEEEEFILPVTAAPNQVYQAYNQKQQVSTHVQQILQEAKEDKYINELGVNAERYGDADSRNNENLERNMLFNAPNVNPYARNNMPSNSQRAHNADRNAEMKKLVLAMSEQGYEAAEIAKTTGMAKGEVALILQLNKK